MGLPTAFFRLAIPVLTSLLAIRFTVRVIRAAFPASAVVRVAERWVSWLAWIAVVLWVTGVLPSVLDALDEIKWKTHAGTLSLLTVLMGALSAGMVLMVSLWISAAVEARLLRGAVGQRLSWRKAAANVVRAVLVFVGLLMALSAVGIDLTALSVLGGALGVGLGFGLLPALRGGRGDLSLAHQSGGRGATVGRGTRRLLQLFLRGIRCRIPKVLGNGRVKEVGLLADDPDVIDQGLVPEVAHILSREQHGAIRCLVEPRNQVRHRRLAGAARTHERSELAGADLERHVGQGRLLPRP